MAVGTAVGLRAAIQVVKWGAKAANQPAPPLDALVVDTSTAVVLEGQDGHETLVVSAEQATQMEAFLQDPAVLALQRLAFVQRLLPEADRKALKRLTGHETFKAMASTWCEQRSEHWLGLTQELWRAVEADQTRVLAHLADNPSLSESIADALAHRFFFGRLGVDREPDYLRLLDEIAKQPHRHRRLREVTDECRRLDEASAHDTFLIQGLEGHEAKFRGLYIDRLLSGAHGEITTAQDELDLSLARPRAVIIGDPGVGKTTLTSWMRWRLSEAVHGHGKGPIAVTLISRRVLKDPGATLLGALRTQLLADYQTLLGEEDLADLLTTGWLALIVDGIDEILDSTQRKSIVTQLHTFAERFPFVSLVCTTRRTGFEVGLFKPTVFKILNLEEYTEGQVQEYAERWFGQQSASLQVERFMGESRSLLDLRQNPLMLALLCTLFRQYDYIPRSRREVYLRCAALMFHEWDPRRGIQIPNLFKSEGEAILRDIALLFHQSGGASQTIDEGQLVQLISGYLKERGQDPVGADSAARGLLEHCSGRAWILSKAGAANEVARFSFTHRTFFEFFAAEALIRRVNRDNQLGTVRTPVHLSLSPVADAVMTAYETDATSVMPELLLQAADDLMGGVSTAVLTELRTQALHGPTTQRQQVTRLGIRLIAAAGVNVAVAEDFFRVMLTLWAAEAPPLNVRDFRPVLDISAGHRASLLAMIAADPEAGWQFLLRYSQLAVLGETGLHADEWRQAARDAVVQPAPGKALSPAVDWFAVQEGLLSLDEAVSRAVCGQDLLFLRDDQQVRGGLLWDTLTAPGESASRLATWRAATRLLLRDPNLRSNDPRVTGLALNIAAPGSAVALPEVPVDLAVILALLAGPDADFVLAAATRRSELPVFTNLLRSLRAALEQGGSRRVGQDEEARRAAAMGAINDGFRKLAPGKRAPLWMKDWVGARDTRRSSVYWF